MALSKGSACYQAILGCYDTLLEETVLCIDPSSGSRSSMPGWALYEGGRLLESGTLILDHTQPLPYRLKILAECVDALYQKFDPDVLVHEEIAAQGHGRDAGGHASLLKSVGVIQSISGPLHTVGIYPVSWKARARKTYVKSDENDAIEIGWVVLEQAREIRDRERERIARKVRKKRKKGSRLKTGRVLGVH